MQNIFGRLKVHPAMSTARRKPKPKPKPVREMSVFDDRPPVVVSTREMSDLFSVTRKTIDAWANEGRVARLGYGRFDLKMSVKRWVLSSRPVTQADIDQINREIAYSELVKHLSADERWALLMAEEREIAASERRARRRG